MMKTSSVSSALAMMAGSLLMVSGSAYAQQGQPSATTQAANEGLNRVSDRDMARVEMYDEQMPVLATPKQSEAAFIEAGNCMVIGREDEIINDYVRDGAMSDPYAKRGSLVPPRGSNCVAKSKNLAGRSLVAAIFNARYNGSYNGKSPGDLSGVGNIDFASEYDNDDGTLPQGVIGLRAYGDCVARADPMNTHRLVTTVYGSKPEDKHFQALAPAMSKCVNEDRKLKFSRLVLRGTLAEALYKLRKAGPAR